MDKKIMLFANGEKGLYSTHDGKLYFPDKKCKDFKPGIYEISITKEFEKYSFVELTPVSTGAIIEMLALKKIDLNDIKYMYLVDDKDQYWLSKDGNLYANINGTKTVIVSLTAYAFLKSDKAKLKFAMDLILNFLKGDGVKSIPLYMMQNAYAEYLTATTPTFASEEEAIEKAINCLWTKPICVEIMDGKILVLNRDKKTNEIGSAFYYDTDENQPEPLFLDKIMKEKHTFVDITQKVNNEIIEKQIALHIGGREEGIESLLVRKTVNCFGEEFEVVFISNRDYSRANYEKVKDILLKNKQDLQNFKKRIGKYCTRSTIGELQKLNFTNYQYGSWI